MKSYCSLIVVIVMLLLAGCKPPVDDSEFFYGKIVLVDDEEVDVLDVSPQKIILDGANYGYISAYDSLLFFMNPKLGGFFYNIFNLKTNEEVGCFVKKGLGPDELTSVGPIVNFYKESEDLKTILFAPNEEKLCVWNISKSIEDSTTIIEEMFPCLWKEDNQGGCYSAIYYINDTLLMKVPSVPISASEATVPYYRQCLIDSKVPLKNISVFKKSIKNKDAYIMPEFFFYSNDAIKPDGTKIVQAMSNIPQLNIVSLDGGEIIGYRIAGGDDFSIFQTDKEIKTYFLRVHADDNFIYAGYWGKEKWMPNEIPYVNLIYVFTWHGELVKRIRLDCDYDNFYSDPVLNRLYLTRPKNDEILYIELADILNAAV